MFIVTMMGFGVSADLLHGCGRFNLQNASWTYRGEAHGMDPLHNQTNTRWWRVAGGARERHSSSADDLIGLGQQRRRQGEAERLGGLQVDD